MPINFFRHIGNPNDALITRISPPENLKDFVEGFYLFNARDLHGRQLFFNDGYPVITLMHRKTGKMRINLNGDIINMGNAWVCGGLLKNIYCESSISTEELFVLTHLRFLSCSISTRIHLSISRFLISRKLSRMISASSIMNFTTMPQLNIKLK